MLICLYTSVNACWNTKKFKRDRQSDCYKVTLMRFRVTIVAVEKQ